MRFFLIAMMCFSLVYGGVFTQGPVLAAPTKDELRDAELSKYNKYFEAYKLVNTSTDGNVITYTYTRDSMDFEGNVCSIYIEIEYKYTLEIKVNRSRNEVTSHEKREEIGRELINGLD